VVNCSTGHRMEVVGHRTLQLRELLVCSVRSPRFCHGVFFFFFQKIFFCFIFFFFFSQTPPPTPPPPGGRASNAKGCSARQVWLSGLLGGWPIASKHRFSGCAGFGCGHRLSVACSARGKIAVPEIMRHKYSLRAGHRAPSRLPATIGASSPRS